MVTERIIQWAEQKRLKRNVYKLGQAILNHTSDGIVKNTCAEAEIDETGYVANLVGLVTGGYDTLNGTIRLEYGERPKISASAERFSEFACDSEPLRYESSGYSGSAENRVCAEHLLVVKELTRRIRSAKTSSVLHHQA